MAIKYEKGTFVVTPNKEALKGHPSELQTLFFWICSYADNNGLCYPSRRTLAQNMASSVPTIDKYLKVLEEIGLIKKENRTQGSKKLTNIYQIMIVEGVGNVVTQPKRLARVAKEVGGGSQRALPGVAKETAYRTQSNVTTPNLTESINSEELTDWELFWVEYPAKKSKTVAEASWLKINPSPELAKLIIEDVKKRKVKDRRWLEGYIPNPSTYLNQQRWEDDITPPLNSSFGNIGPRAPAEKYDNIIIHKSK